MLGLAGSWKRAGNGVLFGPAALLTILAMASGAPESASAAPSCTASAGQRTCVFSYIGDSEDWTVPAHIASSTMQIEAYGGPGGDGKAGAGGRGAAAIGTVSTAAGQTFRFVAGQRGENGQGANSSIVVGGTRGAGGYPNGGRSGIDVANAAGGGGGGSSIAFRVTGPSTSELLMVAGGGGGGGGGSYGFIAPNYGGGAGGDADSDGGNGLPFPPPFIGFYGGLGGKAGTIAAPGASAFGGTSCPSDPTGQSGAAGATLGIGEGGIGQGGLGGPETLENLEGGGGGGGLHGGGGGGAGGVCVTGLTLANKRYASGGGGGGGASGTTGSVTSGVVGLHTLPGNGRVVVKYAVADAVDPNTEFSGVPATLTDATSAPFSFTATDSGGSGVAGFECKLDGGAWEACTSPKMVSGLGDGSHTFSVRAVDGVSNRDQTPATFTWTVDTSPPVVTITPAPAAPVGGEWFAIADLGTGAGLPVSVSADDGGGSGVYAMSCTVNGGAAQETDAPQLPLTLGQGTNVVSCVAGDQLGALSSPSEATYKVDTIAPVSSFRVSGDALAASSCPTTVPVGAARSIPWFATDAGSGIVAPASGDTALDVTAGKHTALPGEASDVAGNPATRVPCDFEALVPFVPPPTDPAPVGPAGSGGAGAPPPGPGLRGPGTLTPGWRAGAVLRVGKGRVGLSVRCSALPGGACLSRRLVLKIPGGKRGVRVAVDFGPVPAGGARSVRVRVPASVLRRVTKGRTVAATVTGLGAPVPVLLRGAAVRR